MPTFNVSFLNPAIRKKSGGSGVGIINDQLTILENTLAKDGFLAPGDYDILIEKAREIKLSGVLSTDQASNYDVKISAYERAKSAQEISLSSDIGNMNKSIENEAKEDVIVSGNNPKRFLEARIASYQAKLNDVTEILNRKTANGENTAEDYNEFQSTLQLYRNKVDNLAAIDNFDQTNPIKGFVAYVETNKNGEIVNIDYSKFGEKTGYTETDGMIEGIQVFGKVNYKEDGKNYFKLGDKTFSAVDMLIPDEAHPGAYKTNQLKATATGGLFSRAEAGYVNMAGDSLKTQDYMPINSWAKGANGSLYKRGEEGEYTKYINAREEDLPINGPIFNMPDSFEQSLMRGVGETVDFSEQMSPEQGAGINQEMGMSIDPARAKQQPETNYNLPNPYQQGKKDVSTQALKTSKVPKEKMSTGMLDTAKRTFKSSVNSFKNMFS